MNRAQLECSRIIRAITDFLHQAIARDRERAMSNHAALLPDYCIFASPFPNEGKPTEAFERHVGAQVQYAPRKALIARFRETDNEELARTIEQVGPNKVPIIACVQKNATSFEYEVTGCEIIFA